MTITLNGTTGITTPALDSVAPFSSADMPAGSVVRVIASTLNSVSNVNATNTSFDTTPNAIIQQSTFSFQPSVDNSKFFVCIPVMLKANRAGPSNAFAGLSWIKQASATAPTTATGFTTNEAPSCVYRSTLSSPTATSDARYNTMNCQGLITPNATTSEWVHVCVKTYTTYTNATPSYDWFEHGGNLPIFAWEVVA